MSTDGRKVAQMTPPPAEKLDYGGNSDKCITTDNVIKKRIIKPLDYADRKNSNSDLHSRLKTRKVLGVGEIRDDKDVYRSKALIFPATMATFDISTAKNGGDFSVPYRLYGSLLLGYAILYKQLTLTKLKSHMTVGLKSAVLVFLLQTSVKLFGGAPFQNAWPQMAGLAGNLLFHELTSQSKLLSIDWLKEWLECSNVGFGAGAAGFASQPIEQQSPTSDDQAATPVTEFQPVMMMDDDTLSKRFSDNVESHKIDDGSDKKLD